MFADLLDASCDAVFGVDPPPAGKKLRELCNGVAYMEEHILHFYFLRNERAAAEQAQTLTCPARGHGAETKTAPETLQSIRCLKNLAVAPFLPLLCPTK